MSTGFAFKQSLHLRSVSNLRIFLVFQPRTFKVGFSGSKTVPGLSRNGPLVSVCECWFSAGNGSNKSVFCVYSASAVDHKLYRKNVCLLSNR